MAEAVDILIVNGTIVDGSDEPAFQGDVAIKQGSIVAVGDRHGNGRLEGVVAAETVDASGCIVTPGWVDAHTHMDGQVTWDPWLTPSRQQASRRRSAATAGWALRRARRRAESS